MSAAPLIRARLFDLVRRAEDEAVAAERATIEVVADARRPGSFVVLLNGAAGHIACRGSRFRCDAYADHLRNNRHLIPGLLRQAQGWRRVGGGR